MRLAVRLASLSFTLALLACSSSGDGDGDLTGATLVVAPADALLVVDNGVAPTQPYTATLVRADGATEDVTATASFTIEASGLGAFTGAELTASGARGGRSTVRAVVGELAGETPVTVKVVQDRLVDGTPPYAKDLFEGPTVDPARAPALVYPQSGIMVPPNLGTFEAHYTDAAGNDFFELAILSSTVELHVFAAGGAAGFLSLTAAEWTLLSASERDGAFKVVVRGASTAMPGIVGESSAAAVQMAREDLQGGVYYWTTTSQGIYRHDFGKPAEAPQPYYTPAESGGNCTGCHALSKDGTKMAVDVANVGSLILDVATRQPMGPAQGWTFATYDPTGTRLLGTAGGQLFMRDGTTGAVLAQVPTGRYATNPDWSPAGDMITYISPDVTITPVETGGDNEAYFTSGRLFVQPFDATNETFGAPQELVPAGAQNIYYPSFSPDGQWILFNRSTGDAIDDPDAELWVVPTDGSRPPLRLDAVGFGPAMHNSWVRWSPFAQVTGPGDEPVFWFTFSSRRQFGVRKPQGAEAQLWMAPFFPQRAAAGKDPSLPAFRLPFQDLATSNHIAQWTEAVVEVE